MKVRLVSMVACAALFFPLAAHGSSDEPEVPDPSDEAVEVDQEAEPELSTPPEGDDDAAPSLNEVLSGVSGVRVATMCTNCNIAGVTMSGQSDERVQVWKDNLPVMGGLGAIYLLSVMPQEGVANASVVNGAGTVLSGSEASAGALKINTKRPTEDGSVHAAIDFGSLNWRRQQLLASGQVGRWGGALVATHSRSDGSDPDGDGNFDLGAFDRETYGGTFTIDATERSAIRLDAIYYEEEQRDNKGGYAGSADVEFGNFYKEDVDILRREYALAWDYKFKDSSKLTLGGRFANRDQETFDDSIARPDQPYMVVDETTEVAELRYERFLAQRHLFTVGVTHRELNVKGSITELNDFQVLDDFIRHKGAFAEAELSLPHRINLTLGLRWDEYDWTPGPESTLTAPIPGPTVRDHYSPRLRLAWRATDKLSLGFSAGDAFAAPRPVFERVCCGGRVLSSAYSDTEVSRNFLMDVDYVPYRWMRLKASLFRNMFHNFLQKMAIRTAPEYIPTFTQVNYSDFALQGATLGMEFRHFERLDYGFELTWLTTRKEDPIIVKRARRDFYEMSIDQIPFHPEHQGSVFVGWNDSRTGFNVSAQALHTGSMYVQFLRNNTGNVRDSWDETPSFWVYNFQVRGRVQRYVSLFGGVDNIGNFVQLWLDDPRYEYNWGPLRGRYFYAGVSFDL
jgi:outer membrane receptor protein involved in Fe transport